MNADPAQSISRTVLRIIRRLIRRAHPRQIQWKALQRHRPNTPVTVRFDGDQRIRVWPRDTIGRYIYVDGLFEPMESQFVCAFLRPGMVFCDIGANLGQYTLLAAKRVGETGAVHSFEPDPRMFTDLVHNVKLNRCRNVVLNQLAIADKEGTAHLARLPQQYGGYATLSAGVGAQGANADCDEAPVTTLDAYASSKELTRIDFIKMDIEGAELLALRGARSILTSPQPPTVLLEVANDVALRFGYGADDVFKYLQELGYVVDCLSSHTGKLVPLRCYRESRDGYNFLARKLTRSESRIRK